MTDVSVVIVSYESRALLARCLAALAADGGRASACEVAASTTKIERDPPRVGRLAALRVARSAPPPARVIP